MNSRELGISRDHYEIGSSGNPHERGWSEQGVIKQLVKIRKKAFLLGNMM